MIPLPLGDGRGTETLLLVEDDDDLRKLPQRIREVLDR